MRIQVKVHPRAKRSCICAKVGDTYKIDVACPPVGGRANHECIALLAEALGLPRSAIRIVAGATSRLKIIELDDVGPETVTRRLGT